MDNRKIKVRIKDTDEVVEVRKVGTNTYLDDINKEIYNSEDFDIIEDTNNGGNMPFGVVPPEEFFKGLKEVIGTREKQLKDEYAKMMLSYEMSLTIEVVKKRPFMSPERVYKKVSQIVKNTLKRLD
jgi:hypothetical protein